MLGSPTVPCSARIVLLPKSLHQRPCPAVEPCKPVPGSDHPERPKGPAPKLNRPPPAGRGNSADLLALRSAFANTPARLARERYCHPWLLHLRSRRCKFSHRTGGRKGRGREDRRGHTPRALLPHRLFSDLIRSQRRPSQASARARRKALSRALRVSVAAALNSERASASRPARNRKSPRAAGKGA